MNFKNAILPIAVAAALLAPIAAQAQGPNGNFVGGSVTAVDAAKKTVTVQGWNQQASTFKVSGSTTYDQSVQGSVSDLKVGDKVRVMGQPSEDDDNTVDARMIMLVPPGAPNGGGFGCGRRGGNRPGGNAAGGGANRPGGGQGGPGGRRRGVSGTIATLSPKFTVTTDDKETKTIDTTDDTRVMVSKSGSFSDIAVGKMVFAQMDNGVAKSVRIMPAFRGGFGGGRRGGGGGN